VVVPSGAEFRKPHWGKAFETLLNPFPTIRLRFPWALGNVHNEKQCLTDRKHSAIRARDVQLPGGGKI
jgi:hypothetical protein